MPLQRTKHLADVRLYASPLYAHIEGLRGCKYLIDTVDILLLLLKLSGGIGQQPPVFVNFVRRKAVRQLSASICAVRHCFIYDLNDFAQSNDWGTTCS